MSSAASRQNNEMFRKRKDTLLRKIHELTSFTGADAIMFLRYGSQVIAYNNNRGGDWPTLEETERAGVLLDHSDFNHQVHRRTVGASLNQSMSVSNDRPYQPNGSGATAAGDLPRTNAVSNNAAPRLIADARLDTAVAPRQMVTNQDTAPLDGQPRPGKGDAVNDSDQQSTNLENTCQSTENLPPPSREHPYPAPQGLRLSYQDMSELVEELPRPKPLHNDHCSTDQQSCIDGDSAIEPNALVAEVSPQSKAQADGPSQAILHGSSVQSSPSMIDAVLDCVSRQASQPDGEVESGQVDWHSQTHSNEEALERRDLGVQDFNQGETTSVHSNDGRVVEDPQIYTHRQTRAQAKRRLDSHEQRRTKRQQ